MTTFKAIDQTASDADKPYSAALAQGVRNNVFAAREHRGRSISKGYELRNGNTPRMIGTYSWFTDNKLVHVMVPFIYVRTRPEITEISVSMIGDQVGAVSTISAVVITMQDAIVGAFQGLDDVANMDNASTKGQVVGTDVEVSFTGSGALTLPPNDTDVFMVFACFKSALVGVVTEIQDSLAGNAMATNVAGTRRRYGSCVAEYNNNAPHTETTQRPDFAVSTDAGSGKTSWPGSDGESPRHAIFIDEGSTFRCVYLYPPLSRNLALGVPLANRLIKNDLSYFDLKSIQIVETAERSPVLDSALNGAKPAAVEPHNVIVTEAEKLALLHTPAFHCGGSIAIDTADSLLSTTADGALNKLHNFVEYTSSFQAIGATTVRPHGDHKTYGEQQQTRVGYRVVAVFAISAAAEVTSKFGGNFQVSSTPNFELDIRLSLSDRDGSATEVNGGTWHGEVASNPHPIANQTILDKSSFSPVGYILRAHHITQLDVQSPNDLLSHTLAGVFPEDVWSDGKYLFYDGNIIDQVAAEDPPNVVPARLLTMQVRGTEVPTAPWGGSGTQAAKSFVHLISWTVVGLSVPRPGLVGEVST